MVQERTAPTYPDLAGKSVLVTGGAQGIGAAIVRAFLAQEARVAFLDVDAAAAGDLLAGVGAPAPRFERCDLRDVAALRRAVQTVAAAQGPIEVLVNNAANDDRHDLATVEPADFDDRIAVNARPAFFACQAVRDDMVAARRGAIVNLGSISWRIGFGGVPVYTMAKAAIVGLTRTLARELGPAGIRVNCVEPGYVATARQRALWMTPELEAAVLEDQALKELIEPAAVADVVLFLAADASRMCTGQTFTVDGGFSHGS